MKKVGIIAKVKSPLAREATRLVCEWLTTRNYETLIEADTAKVAGYTSSYKKSDLIDQSDLIVVMGGDGTFLSVARMVDSRTIPLMGVNLGSLGFLTEFAYEETIDALERVLAGDFVYEDRIMLDVEISREGKQVATYTVLNDLVINRGALARMVEVRVDVDGALLNTYTADGLIVSTPTGSTAYNLAANGPIVHPSLNAVIVSPICPHTLSNRPIVIPDNVEIEISLSEGNMANEAVASLDGQVGYQLSHRDKITACRSKQATRVILSHKNDYYKLLRSKMKWGAAIRNGS